MKIRPCLFFFLFFLIILCPKISNAAGTDDNPDFIPAARDDCGHGNSKKTFSDAVSIYHENYFLLGPHRDLDIDNTNLYGQYCKFQLSVKFRLFIWDAITDETGLYFAYTQKSLWDLFRKKGGPEFVESNYSPEFFYKWCTVNSGILKISGLNYLQIGFWQHESNGLGDASKLNSRGWDRGYFEFEYEILRQYLSLRPKAWVIYRKAEENRDITRYLGYGEIRLRSDLIKNSGLFDLAFTADFKKGTGREIRDGSMELTLVVGPFAYEKIPMGVYLQYFRGYGETLMQYNRYNSSFRAGLSILTN